MLIGSARKLASRVGGPTHFASARARLEVSSAPGIDGPWRHETTISLGAGLREPRWVVVGGQRRPTEIHLHRSRL